jgi:hypothetical protein
MQQKRRLRPREMRQKQRLEQRQRHWQQQKGRREARRKRTRKRGRVGDHKRPWRDVVAIVSLIYTVDVINYKPGLVLFVDEKMGMETQLLWIQLTTLWNCTNQEFLLILNNARVTPASTAQTNYYRCMA